MRIGADLPPDYELTHDDLASAFGTLVAHTLLPIFAEGMSEEPAKANAAGILIELAYAFDEGEIEIGGRTYRPRLAFVDDQGTVVNGFETLDTFAELAEDPFDVEEEAHVTFEETSQ